MASETLFCYFLFYTKDNITKSPYALRISLTTCCRNVPQINILFPVTYAFDGLCCSSNNLDVIVTWKHPGFTPVCKVHSLNNRNRRLCNLVDKCQRSTGQNGYLKLDTSFAIECKALNHLYRCSAICLPLQGPTCALHAQEVWIFCKAWLRLLASFASVACFPGPRFPRKCLTPRMDAASVN